MSYSGHPVYPGSPFPNIPIGYVMGTCDVHRLIEGDVSPRPVAWCQMCKAYICEPCSRNPIRRAKAAALKLLGR